MECALCKQDGRHMSRCVECDRYFCNKAIEYQHNHVLRHVAETGHCIFEFAEVGIPYCAQCACQDITRLYQDDTGAFLCDWHKQMHCRKISIGRIVFRNPDPDEQHNALFKELLCAAETQSANEELLVIPNSFPQLGRQVCYVGGVPIVYKELQNYVNLQQVEYKEGYYVSTIPALQQRIEKLEMQQFGYQEFFARALKAEQQYELLQAQVFKHKIKNDDISISVSKSNSCILHIAWGSKKKLCGYKVKYGSIVSVLARSSDRILEFTGRVQLIGPQLLIETIVPPAKHDVMDLIAQSNDYQFSISISDTNILRKTQMLAIARLDSASLNLFSILKGETEENESGKQVLHCFMRTTYEAENLLLRLRKQLAQQQKSGQTVLPPNETYAKAIRHSLINRVSLIQGCPGGGKTYTAALLVKCLLLAYNNGRILCCAGSNTAADNLVEMLDKIGIKALRVYARTKEECDNARMSQVLKNSSLHLYVQKKLYYYASKAKTAQKESVPGLEHFILKSAAVVVATCGCTGFGRFKKMRYDAVLIDEASHIIEPEAILPVFLATSQLILIGDQQQLGPIVKNQVARQAGFAVSLFKRLNRLYIPFVKLMQQYRMHPALLELPNRLFYNNYIQSMVDAEDRSVFSEKCNLQSPLAKLLQKQPFLLWHTKEAEKLAPETKSYYNLAEANRVLQLVQALVKDLRVPMASIGVITPYSAQQSLLESLFPSYNKPEIDSVDAFQGREKEVIVLSCVRSNDDGAIGFLHQSERLNVAMTRGRRALLIVGNAEQLANSSTLWKRVVEYYAEKQQLYAGDSLKSLISVQLRQENQVQNTAAPADHQVEKPRD